MTAQALDPGQTHNDMLRQARDSIHSWRELPGNMVLMLRAGAWRQLVRPVDGRVFEVESVADWILGPAWPGLDFPDWATVYALLQKNIEHGPECLALLQQEGAPSPAEAERAFLAKLPPEPPHGGSRTKGHKQGDNVTLDGRGNAATYLMRRLKRDHEEIAAALARGEYSSAYAAAKAAGIITPPTAFQRLQGAWRQATLDERSQFLTWVETERVREEEANHVGPAGRCDPGLRPGAYPG